MTTSDKSWVWFADRTSRAAGHVSLLAVAETIAAVAFYWWLALRIDTAFMLIASPLVAFLVLLRSSQSIAEGVRLIDDFLDQKEPGEVTRRAGWTVSLLVAAFSVYFAISLLDGVSGGWALWWKTSLIALGAINLAAAMMTAILGTDWADSTDAAFERIGPGASDFLGFFC